MNIDRNVVQERITSLITEKIADAFEKRTFLRKILDEQLSLVEGENRLKSMELLGEYGHEEDSENALNEIIENEIPEFLSYLYEKICANDSRLHNTLWLLGDDTLEALCKKIEEHDGSELNRAISKFIFTFDDIKRFDDRSIQKILRETDTYDLAQALKLASEETRNAIFRNLSKRAANMLKEDISYISSENKKSIRDAQRHILWIVDRLSSAGEILLPYYTKYDQDDGAYLRG